MVSLDESVGYIVRAKDMVPSQVMVELNHDPVHEHRKISKVGSLKEIDIQYALEKFDQNRVPLFINHYSTVKKSHFCGQQKVFGKLWMTPSKLVSLDSFENIQITLKILLVKLYYTYVIDKTSNKQL